jgi:xanthine dehydrogenase molybdenum-binding subunit
MELNLNGKPINIDPQPGEMLVDLLREQLDLTGTKVGCNEAECGSCTVVIDGEAVLACAYPAARAAGRNVITIEGLSQLVQTPDEVLEQDESVQKRLHPVQEAFIKHGAVQCGFCIPGQIMTAYALLEHDPDPNDEAIRHALKDTLCRCAGYPSILNAVKASGERIRTGKPIGDAEFQSATPLDVIGNSYIRPDALDKVIGRTKFTDDLKFEDMVHARVKRAGVPHAIVKRLDIEKARQLPGVLAVLTAEDIPGEKNHGLVIYDWPVLVGVGERVRTIGDALAIVAAESRPIATQALDLIEVEFEDLPVVNDPVQALDESSPAIHPDGNLLKHIKVRKGDVALGFAEADLVFEHVFYTGIYEHAFIEPECSIARLTPEGRMEIYVGSQIPYADRNQIARVLGWPEEKVRVIGMMIGGGFGGKEDIAGQIHAALLTERTGQPVKLLFDRHESLLVHPKRHATQIRIKMGAKRDGRLTAVESELYGDTGSYASLGEKVMTRATTHSSGPYQMPHAKADCYAMYTNNPPAGAFRGFGVTQSCFAVESMMDMMAERLEVNPIEIRRINALSLGSTTNTGQELKESVGLLECIQQVQSELESRSDGDPFKPRSSPEADHLRRAWGFAVAYKNTGLGGGAPDKSAAEVELCSDGILEVRTSSAEIGQGLVTVLQLIVAQEFTTSPGYVRVLLSDTDLTPDGGPTTASRQTYVSGNAARMAAQVLHQAISSTLAEKYDCPPQEVHFEEGLVRLNSNSLPMEEVYREMKEEGRSPRALYEYWAPSTGPLGDGGDMHFAYSFAAQAAEVEVNTNTGEVEVLNVIVANDVGKALNPLGLQGQVEGGVVMGLGNALTEHFIVDEGRVVTDRLARYRMPSIVQTPQIHSIVVEHPTQDGPYGAKGVGELSSIPTTPAITNAIYNAVGVRFDKLPVDQEEIIRQLNQFSKVAEYHGK